MPSIQGYGREMRCGGIGRGGDRDRRIARWGDREINPLRNSGIRELRN
jgi:hypothetical protein